MYEPPNIFVADKDLNKSMYSSRSVQVYKSIVYSLLQFSAYHLQMNVSNKKYSNLSKYL